MNLSRGDCETIEKVTKRWKGGGEAREICHVLAGRFFLFVDFVLS